MNRATSPSRRGFVLRLAGAGFVVGLGVLGIGAAGEALAQPQRGQGGRERLDADERDRLRRDLRERGFDGWPRRDTAPDPRRDGGRPDPGYGGAGRLSDAERQQLRRQLREAGRRRD